MTVSHQVLVFFREITPDDVSQEGSARHELKITPASEYHDFLQRMLSHPGPEWDVTQDAINWTRPTGEAGNAIVELRPPKKGEQDVLHITRIDDVDVWHVAQTEYVAAREAGEKWFYVLEEDPSETRTARILKSHELEKEDPLVADHIRKCIENTPPGEVVQGAIDVRAHETIP